METRARGSLYTLASNRNQKKALDSLKTLQVDSRGIREYIPVILDYSNCLGVEQLSDQVELLKWTNKSARI